MLNRETRLKVFDNSGAKEILIIGIPGNSKTKFVGIGDRVIATVKSAIPNGNIKKGDIVSAIIISTRNKFKRANGNWISFSYNGAVIVNKNTKDPVGTRIFIPLVSELDSLGYKKFFPLSAEVI